MSPLPTAGAYRADASPAARSLPLYRVHVPRMWMVLAAVFGVVFSICMLTVQKTGDAVVGGLFGGFMVALMTWVVLIISYDRQRASFLTCVVSVLELSARGVALRAPGGELLGERVYRANTGTKATFGALGVDYAGGTLVLQRAQPLGAWSGLPLAVSTQPPFTVDASLFDAILHRAGE